MEKLRRKDEGEEPPAEFGLTEEIARAEREEAHAGAMKVRPAEA
jgi:hypothetical protein